MHIGNSNRKIFTHRDRRSDCDNYMPPHLQYMTIQERLKKEGMIESKTGCSVPVHHCKALLYQAQACVLGGNRLKNEAKC